MTLQIISLGVVSNTLLASLTLIDDSVITFFIAGVDSTTLHVFIIWNVAA